jgi:hypothetical protein
MGGAASIKPDWSDLDRSNSNCDHRNMTGFPNTIVGSDEQYQSIEARDDSPKPDQICALVLDTLCQLLDNSGILLLSRSVNAKQHFYRYFEIHYPEELDMILMALSSRSGQVFPIDPDVKYTIMMAFPWFMTSSGYTDWCRNRLGLSPEASDPIGNLELLFTDYQKPPLNSLLQIVIVSTLKHPECIYLMKSPWFHSFAEATEGLPIGVSLVLADDAKEYPIMYSNKSMEDMFGVPRNHSLGAPWKNHQEIHRDSMPRMHAVWSSLKSSVPARVDLSHVLRDGRPLKTTVLTKPVYDMGCRYRFMVMIQIVDHVELLKVAGDFLAIVPNLVPCESMSD